jgi:glycosyltransferase involved in cell wall biosynthesis
VTRVLVVAGESPLPPTSGLRQRILHLSRQLAAAFELELLVLGDVPPADAEPFVLEGVAHERSRARALARSLGSPYEAAKVRSLEFARLISEGRWSTVQAELPFVASAALAARIPLVLDAHNIEADVLATLGRTDGRPLHRLRWRWESAKTERLERRVMTAAAAVCTTSDADAAAAERLGSRRTVVVPNGVDCASVRYGPPADTVELLYVGHFGYRPNVLAAIELVDEVLPRVQALVPDARILLVGREPTPELLSRAGESVTIAADVPEVLPFLQRSRALVVPLRAGGGTRLKVLEALAAGVPVVSTPFGVAGLGVRDDREVLLGESAADLAAQCVRVLTEDELAAALSSQGRALAERDYDWSVVARPLIDLHSELSSAC